MKISGLPLKSGIAFLGNGNFICVEAFSDILRPGRYIIVDGDERYSANCLLVNDSLLFPK